MTCARFVLPIALLLSAWSLQGEKGGMCNTVHSLAPGFENFGLPPLTAVIQFAWKKKKKQMKQWKINMPSIFHNSMFFN